MKTLRHLVVPVLLVGGCIAAITTFLSSMSGLRTATEVALENSHPSSVAYQLGDRAKDGRLALTGEKEGEDPKRPSAE